MSYTITEGNVNNVFGIKQKTGDLYVAKTLDYETPPTVSDISVIIISTLSFSKWIKNEVSIFKLVSDGSYYKSLI